MCLPLSELLFKVGVGVVKWKFVFFLIVRLKVVIMGLVKMGPLWGLPPWDPGWRVWGKWSSRGRWSSVSSGLNCNLSVSLKSGYLDKGSGQGAGIADGLRFFHCTSTASLHTFPTSFGPNLNCVDIWPWWKDSGLLEGFYNRSGPPSKGGKTAGYAREIEYLAQRLRSC